MSRKKRSFLVPVGVAIASLLGTIDGASAAPQQQSDANTIGEGEFALASPERPQPVDLILAPLASSTIMLAAHSSHASHGSHGSHSSHRSGS